MAGEPAHIVLRLDTTQPIEVGDFVSAFTSLAHQYEEFVRDNFPQLKLEADIYVREVRAGSIEADLIPWLMKTLAPVVSVMDQLLVVEKFIKSYGDKLGAYLSGHRIPDATRSDLKDFMGSIAAIANDPNGHASLEAVYFEDQRKKVRAAIKFNSKQARTAVAQIEEHSNELNRETDADHKRVLMVFSQSNVKDTQLGKRTGEWVTIEELGPKDLPLIYASDLAERRIKHEIREADDNVYKKGFVVDVNIQMKGGKRVAYRVTNLHQVIDLPD